MTARLPVPGADDNTWGEILNEFLEVSHNGDGTLQSSALQQAGGELTANKGQAGGYASLNSGSLVPTTQLGTGAPGGSNFLRGDGVWAVPAGGGGSSTLAGDTDVSITSAANGQGLLYNSSTSKWTNQDIPQPANATSGAVGLIQLSGDLGGSATLPTVSKLQGITVNASTPTDGQVLTYQNAGNQWVPSTVSSTTVSDATTSSKGIIQLSGDLGGVASSPSVLKVNGVALPGSAPSNGQVLTATSNNTTTWTTPSSGLTEAYVTGLSIIFG